MLINRDNLPEWTAIEVPVGSPQIKHQPGFENEWAPRGGVLRCTIESDGTQPTICIDDHEFSWAEFGQMVSTYAGWGMRVIFVPDDEIDKDPKIFVQEPASE